MESDLDTLWERLAPNESAVNSGLTQRRGEITELWSLYQRRQPRVVLEIGTAQGGTFAGWCQLGHPEATIISIDRDTNDARPRTGEPVHPDIYTGPLANTENGGGLFCLRKHRQTIHAISGWSMDFSTTQKLKEILGDRSIDFLFHDASHEATMFARDFEIYWPLVAQGGVFAAHDIAHSAAPDCNKSVTWERIKHEADYAYSYEYMAHSSFTEMGIGVLIK
jgi:predicted O-methyltransferase YrrM